MFSLHPDSTRQMHLRQALEIPLFKRNRTFFDESTYIGKHVSYCGQFSTQRRTSLLSINCTFFVSSQIENKSYLKKKELSRPLISVTMIVDVGKCLVFDNV